jgi:hypothetical protein
MGYKTRIAAVLSSVLASAGAWIAASGPSASAQVAGTITVNCSPGAAGRRAISPLIYGLNYQGFADPWLTGDNNRQLDWDGKFGWGVSTRRFGGDATSRYNWRIGNVENAGFNNTFANGFAVFTGNTTSKVWEHFLDENKVKGLGSTYSVPMLGWVAKDATSTTPSSGGVPANVPQSTTSNASSTADIADLVTAVGTSPVSANGRRAVDVYILDNEPDIWHSTHSDVAKGLNRTNLSQAGVSTAELVQRSKEYADAIRSRDAGAKVAGPAVSGPYGMVFSGSDRALQTSSGGPNPEFNANGQFLADYLMKANAAGVGLNYVDVHYYAGYANAEGNSYDNSIYNMGTGPTLSAKRIENVQGLWKPGYKTERAPGAQGDDFAFTFIPGDPGDARILPRVQAAIDTKYPGLGITIGEYNFGGPQYMSGALAQAEALGRFAQAGVYSAYYWPSAADYRVYPTERIPVGFGFKAYRNYNGTGGQFGDVYMPSSVPTALDGKVSLHASTNAAGTKTTLVALNLDPANAANTTISLSGCSTGATATRWTYAAAETTPSGAQATGWTAANRPTAFTNAGNTAVSSGSFTTSLPAYSINVIEITNSASPVPANSTLPAIAGTTTVGQTLSTSNGTWTNSPTSYTYQWQSCDASGNNCNSIAGATNQTYVLVSGDAGRTIRVAVTATNSGGNSTPAVSSQTAAIAGQPNSSAEVVFNVGAFGSGWTSWSNGGAPTIVNSKLTYNLPADPSEFMSFSRSTAIASAPAALEFKVKTNVTSFGFQAFNGNTGLGGLSVSLPAAGTDGYRVVSVPWSSLFSGPAPSTFTTFYLNPASTAAQAIDFEYVRLTTGSNPPPPVNTVLPVISGTTTSGQTLTATNGTWNNSPTSFARVWQRCNSTGASCTPISGATAQSYTLVPADVGSTIRVNVTATNATGSAGATSAQTAVIAPVGSVPVNTALPTITGTVQVGSVLSVSNGTWTNAPTTYTRSWQRCDGAGANCVAIAGATAATYTLVAADAAKTIRVVVGASNASGTGAAVTTAQSGLIRYVDNVFNATLGAGWGTYSSAGAAGTVGSGLLTFNLPVGASQFTSYSKSTAITPAPVRLEFRVKTTSSTLSFNSVNGTTLTNGNTITLPAPAADGFRTVVVNWTTLFPTTPPATMTGFYLNPAGTAAQQMQFSYLRLIR